MMSKFHHYVSDIRPQKWLGQNFLIDKNIINIIVDTAELSKDDLVIEIGAGYGSLTYALAKFAKKVIAIELDRRLFQRLGLALSDVENVIPVNADVLKIDLKQLLDFQGISDFASIKVVGNIPYYIATSIITKAIEESRMIPISVVIFMVQKELAQRMVAPPGGKDYGAFSIAVQSRSEVSIVRFVPASCFRPKPKVDSALVKMVINKDRMKNEELFFELVRNAFQHRRKTLRNALLLSIKAGQLDLEPELLDYALNKLKLDPMIRAEALNITDYSELARIIAEQKENEGDR